jgi:hypothetical protein
MRKLFLLAIAGAALASAPAFAQAVSYGSGGPPKAYPPCSRTVTDECTQTYHAPRTYRPARVHKPRYVKPKAYRPKAHRPKTYRPKTYRPKPKAYRPRPGERG